MESSPEAAPRPGAKAAPAGRAAAAPQFQRQQLPRQARAEDEDDAREHLAVAHAGSPALRAGPALPRQNRRHHGPQRIVDERFHVS